MAQIRDLIIRSGLHPDTGDKTFIRIGDEKPATADNTASSIQFLGDLRDNNKSFDNIGTASAFRIRHDTVNGALYIQSSTNSNKHTLIQFQDEGYVNIIAPTNFLATTTFDDITFDSITGSYLYIGTNSQLYGTTSIANINNSSQLYMDLSNNLIFENDGNSLVLDRISLIFTSSAGTASLYYQNGALQIQGYQGKSWKTQYRLTASYNAGVAYPIYTQNANQRVENYNYLTVLVNGDTLIQSSSLRKYQQWDYKPNGSDSNSIVFRYPLPVVPGDDFYITYIYNAGN